MEIAWRSVKTYTDILYHKADGIAKVTINRPEKRNAFRPQTVFEMYDAFCDAIGFMIENICICLDRSPGDFHAWYRVLNKV